MGGLTTEERRRRRFSEIFRREQVALIDKGAKTISQVSREYHVKPESVRRWVLRFGKVELPQQILIQTQEDVNRIKDLEKETEHLHRIIGEQQVELHYLRACMSLAKERLGTDFEKKTGRR